MSDMNPVRPGIRPLGPGTSVYVRDRMRRQRGQRLRCSALRSGRADFRSTLGPFACRNYTDTEWTAAALGERRAERPGPPLPGESLRCDGIREPWRGPYPPSDDVAPEVRVSG